MTGFGFINMDVPQIAKLLEVIPWKQVQQCAYTMV